VKGKGESEAGNYREALALHAEVKALPEAKEEAGTHQRELAAQIDEIRSLKAENVSEDRNTEEELAALLDEIRTLREAKASEPHNDHGELAARLEEIIKKSLEALIIIIVNAYTEAESKLGADPLTESLVVTQEHVKCGFKAFFLHNSTPPIEIEWLLHFLRKIFEHGVP
jgi:vacuolar-type H+-ATPase subunit I/STV1